MKKPFDTQPTPDDLLRRDTINFLDSLHRHQLKKVIIKKQLFVDYSYQYNERHELAHRFDLPEFTALFQISARTAHRWLQPGAVPPVYVYRHLALITGAVLPSARFKGFYFADDGLYTPAGRRFDPGTLETVAWNIQEAQVLRREYKRLREETDKTLERLRIGLDYWRRLAGAPVASNDD